MKNRMKKFINLNNNIIKTTTMLIHKNNNILNECYKINSNQKILLMDYYKRFYNDYNEKIINNQKIIINEYYKKNNDNKIIKMLLLTNAIQSSFIIGYFFIYL